MISPGAKGMRADNLDRVKRRLLQQAVADNLDTIRGLPPRALRPERRWSQLLLKRAPLALIPLALLGSSYLMRDHGSNTATATPRVLQSLAAPFIQPAPAPDALGTPERVTASAFPLSVRRVVLDSGHGGTDPGASRDDLLEKAITLDVGRRLRALLEHDGFEVVVTRGDDRTIALSDRASLANASKSDIFVSIHVNAIIKHTASRGIETYYLGPTNDPSLTELAAAENRVSGYSLADMRKLLDGVYADARRDESQQLATLVQRRLFDTLRTVDPGIENWGTKRAPFLVLVATDMPAILAEVGCLSNEKEAAMLRRPEYRQKIADALFAGIRAYATANDAPQKKGIARNG
ncbi:MAG: N-acetylmuramoyl-L-alanine amidase [Acidobacteriota bacterium]|nr:N-acetylmuramoyl-L-alanine amidase [Acidobacteriota bacterium]